MSLLLLAWPRLELLEAKDEAEVKASGPGMDFRMTLVSLVRSIELLLDLSPLFPPILNIVPRPRSNLEFLFFFRSSLWLLLLRLITTLVSTVGLDSSDGFLTSF